MPYRSQRRRRAYFKNVDRLVEEEPDPTSAGGQQVPTGCVPDTQSDNKSANCQKWECSKHCKPLSDSQIVAIVTLKAAFDGSVQGARGALAECDFGLPHWPLYQGSV